MALINKETVLLITSVIIAITLIYLANILIMTESDYNSMTILELHALAQEVRMKLEYGNVTVKQRNTLHKQLQQIEINIDERYLDC